MGHNALKTPFVVVTWDRSNSSQKKKNAVSLLFQIGGHMQPKPIVFMFTCYQTEASSCGTQHFCQDTQQIFKMLKISLWVFLVINNRFRFSFLKDLFFLKISLPQCNLFPLVSYLKHLLSLTMFVEKLCLKQETIRMSIITHIPLCRILICFFFKLCISFSPTMKTYSTSPYIYK